MSKTLTHVDSEGRASMVDVSSKARVRRTAVAEGTIGLLPSTIELIKANAVAKGNVLATARVAGIMAAKRCSDLIPLCHNIEIEHVEVGFEVLDDRIDIEAKAVCTDKTGIEMEVLTAVCVAALTIYDMCKAVDRRMKIGEIRLVEKRKEIV